jgi:hypothetical protein
LVERGGSARSFHVDGTTVGSLIPIIRANVQRESVVMTDEASWYRSLGGHFMSHDAVNHEAKEWARGEISTNTVEGYYSIFKRGMKGVYQHCAEKHLHRYLAEFVPSWSSRLSMSRIRLAQMVARLRPHTFAAPTSLTIIGIMSAGSVMVKGTPGASSSSDLSSVLVDIGMTMELQCNSIPFPLRTGNGGHPASYAATCAMT